MTLVPPAIRQFRLVYGLVVLLTAVNIVLTWPGISATLARYPQLGTGGNLIVMATVLVGFAIPVLIWWFAGWRRSRIARLALVLLVAVAVLFLVRALLAGVVFNAETLVRVAGLVLQVIALVLLFRADAKPWFNRRAGPL